MRMRCRDLASARSRLIGATNAEEEDDGDVSSDNDGMAETNVDDSSGPGQIRLCFKLRPGASIPDKALLKRIVSLVLKEIDTYNARTPSESSRVYLLDDDDDEDDDDAERRRLLAAVRETFVPNDRYSIATDDDTSQRHHLYLPEVTDDLFDLAVAAVRKYAGTAEGTKITFGSPPCHETEENYLIFDPRLGNDRTRLVIKYDLKRIGYNLLADGKWGQMDSVL